MTNNQLTATDAFMMHSAHVNDLLERITEHCVENNFNANPEKITWADVGTAEHTYRRLEQLCEFLNIDITT